MLLVAALAAAGCGRDYYRRQADDEAYQIIGCAARDERWAGPQYRIDPQYEARFFDPYDPDRPLSGGCHFIKEMTTAKRTALIRHRAHQQARYGFRFSYPALFPECMRYRRNRTYLESYNAFRDPPMARTIMKMLNRYD